MNDHDGHIDASFWSEAPRPAWWSWRHAVELVGVFITGALVLNFLYAGTGGVNGDYIAVPGYDSFYHTKMAMLLPEIGLPDKFPWLTTTIFADKFVSHHYGFHALLYPFLKLSQWVGSGDPLQGARWAIVACFGGVMLLFDLLLITERVRYRPVWLLMFLLMPHQFFGRHVFVRAICPSLLFMLALMLAMFRRRYVLAGVVIFLYTQLYLGSVMYSPVLVIAYFVAGLLGPPGERVSWKLPAWTLAGWVLGLAVHPYGGLDAIEFLKVQVLGTGLDPDISVGREWKSYTPAWFFAQMSAATLVLLATGICLRMRRGPRLNARATALLIVNFVFLALTLKARRFIEYWPLFSVLSSAYLLAGLPGLHVPSSGDADSADQPRRVLPMGAFMPTGFFVAAAVATVLFAGRLRIEPFAAEWPAWSFALAWLALPAAAWWWSVRAGGRDGGGRSVLVAVGGTVLTIAVVAGIAVAVCAAAFGREELPDAKLRVGWWWAALGIACILVPWYGARRVRETSRGDREGHPDGRKETSDAAGSRKAARFDDLAGGVLGGAGLCLLVPLFAAGPLVDVQRNSRCGFHLAAIDEAMAYIETHSEPSEIIFTDDWDIFGVFFYHNHHNRFIVGLDPKFSHERDPILWERYTRITQAKTPTSFVVKGPQDDGEGGGAERVRLRVTLDDIREHFHAQWVVIDDDHKDFASKLEARSDLAELVYTSPYESNGVPRYKVYRIRDKGAAIDASPPRRMPPE